MPAKVAKKEPYEEMTRVSVFMPVGLYETLKERAATKLNPKTGRVGLPLSLYISTLLQTVKPKSAKSTA